VEYSQHVLSIYNLPAGTKAGEWAIENGKVSYVGNPL
jgi:hypothetical protein